MEPSKQDPPPRDPATAPRAAGPDATAWPSGGGIGQTGRDADRSIVPIPAERCLEAIQALLRSDKGAAQRFIQFAGEHRIRLDTLWGRIDQHGRIVFAALVSAGAGRTATLFATAARADGEVAPLAQLIDRVLASLGSLKVDLVQALVDPSEKRQVSVYEQGGMNRLASLTYMERPLLRGAAGEAGVWPADLTIERWDAGLNNENGASARMVGTPASRAELIDTLERSYVGTLDCPALAGLRHGEDVLDGHLHSGTFEPTLWTVLRFRSGPYAGRAAGVCLFNSSTNAAATGALELVYFGLVPEARGRGLGRLLLQHGLDGLRDRCEATVMLAVDDRNEPAHRIYRQAGFRTRFRRIALIRSMRNQA